MQHFAYIPALRNRSILRYFRNNHQLAANGARISVQRQVVFYQHVTSLVAYLCNKNRRSHRTIWHISPPDTAFFMLFVDVFESEKPPFAFLYAVFRTAGCRLSQHAQWSGRFFNTSFDKTDVHFPFDNLTSFSPQLLTF